MKNITKIISVILAGLMSVNVVFAENINNFSSEELEEIREYLRENNIIDYDYIAIFDWNNPEASGPIVFPNNNNI